VGNFHIRLWKRLWKTLQAFSVYNLKKRSILPKRKLACGKLQNRGRKKIFQIKVFLLQRLYLMIFSSKITSKLKSSPKFCVCQRENFGKPTRKDADSGS
jgi:hypothetical protein